jgi:transposase
MNYFRHGGRRTNAATEARNRVIKMTNRLGAGYSFDMIRARSLFGKRPGRVKAEAGCPLANMVECSSCKALFPKRA